MQRLYQNLYCSDAITDRGRILKICSDRERVPYVTYSYLRLFRRLAAVNDNLILLLTYSQLEGKVVDISCHINPFDVLPMMWSTLAVVLVITVLLIICLILQFGMVLKLSRLDRMRNSFVTTMIHELKRPLSTLKMCVSGLDNERILADPEIRKEMLA